MIWLSLGLGVAALLAIAVVIYHRYVMRTYLPYVVRIFQEKPLFIIPRGQPVPDAQDVSFPSSEGLLLRGCYLPCAGERQGVILFGLEFGSNRWACVPYCEFLRKNGYDIFAFEYRNQGDSDAMPGYEPLQWVTDYEVRDFQAALAYLKGREDADPRGVGFFGLSKGGSAGLIAGAADDYVRCFVTDGIFAAHTTMIPYMQKWLPLYTKRGPRSSRSDRFTMQAMVPRWYFALAAKRALDQIEKERGCRFPHLEHIMGKLAPRPLLMIHGGGDTYIKPEMAQALFDLAKGPKEFWRVDGAKHNQAFHVANGNYQRRVLEFFDTHLSRKEWEAPAEKMPTPDLAAAPER